jgi:predicted nucleotidyltransferase
MNIDQVRKFAPQIHKIAMKHGISKIYLFGSVARGEPGMHSDVDFLVEMRAGASLFGIFSRKTYIL